MPEASKVRLEIDVDLDTGDYKVTVRTVPSGWMFDTKKVQRAIIGVLEDIGQNRKLEIELTQS